MERAWRRRKSHAGRAQLQIVWNKAPGSRNRYVQVPGVWKCHHLQMPPVQGPVCKIHLPCVWRSRTVGDIMGDVVTTYQISPESEQVDLRKLMEEVKLLIPKEARVQRFEAVPLAFGMNVLMLNFVISDKIGGVDEFEEQVSRLESVSSISVKETGLA